jgi:hypothetical protein
MAEVPPGLDVRPVNVSCLAPERPLQVISTTAVIAFPNLTFDEATDLVQAPYNDATWYIAERKGLIRSFANDEAATTSDIVLDRIVYSLRVSMKGLSRILSRGVL